MRVAIVFALIWVSVCSAQKTNERQWQVLPEMNPPHRKLELYRCKESKIKTNFIPNVPSYPFYQMVNISIRKEPFPGCKSQRIPSNTKLTSLLEILYNSGEFWGLADFILNKDEWIGLKPEFDAYKLVFKDIEQNGTSLSPHGFLNVKDHNYDLDEFCIQDFKREQFNGILYNHTLLEISYCPHDCKKGVCISKCCPLGQSLLAEYSDEQNSVNCDLSGEMVWKGFMYDANGKRKSKSDESQKYHYFRTVISCDKRPPPLKNATVEYWFKRDLDKGNVTIKKTLFRLSENGELLFLGASRKFQPFPKGIEFCIDGLQEKSDGYSGSEDDQIAVICSDYREKCYKEGEEWKSRATSRAYMVCLFMACIFYLATTTMYLLLWDSQKVHGWTVVSLTISLFFMCTTTAMAHLYSLNLLGGTDLRLSIRCKANAILAHYFYIASFTWLCLVNYDIWSTFRALKRRNDKDLMKLVWYSLVGWGIPLVFICISITLNELYPERDSMILIPEYGDNFCFVVSWAQGAYIYYPLLLPIVIIIALTASTFWNLYGFQRDSAMARSSSSKSDKQLAKLYMKLSLILGTSWTFEVISWLASTDNCQHWIWMIADLYNALSAILIFLFFGMKESNILLLEEKYRVFKGLRLSRFYRDTAGEPSGQVTKSTGISSKDKESSSSSSTVVDEKRTTKASSSQGYGSTGAGTSSNYKS